MGPTAIGVARIYDWGYDVSIGNVNAALVRPYCSPIFLFQACLFFNFQIGGPRTSITPSGYAHAYYSLQVGLWICIPDTPVLCVGLRLSLSVESSDDCNHGLTSSSK